MKPRGEPEYAHFWQRAAASLVDIVLFAALAFVVHLMAGLTVSLILTGIGYVAYSAVLEGSSYNATLGKYLFGLRVTDLDGGPVSRLRAAGRSLAKLVSVAVFPLGHAIVSFTDHRQSLHDLLAGTLVVGRK
jgi:uncharacterized RDD family membrane protein YckC